MMRYLSIFLLAGCLMSAGAQTSFAQAFEEEQKSEIEKIVREYILEHPEIIYQVLEILEARQREEQGRKTKEMIFALSAELEQDPGDPVMGNPDGDVTIVEFFDYQCGYCKRMTGPLMELVEKDGNIRLVLKEFPILGPASTIAARASLGALAQGKYEAFHLAMMGLRGRLDQDAILQVALEVGLDMAKLQDAMNDPEIEAQIRKSYKLAQALSISGTPAFIVGDELMPGAVPAETLAESVARVRAAR